jgi:hypothetical protein
MVVINVSVVAFMNHNLVRYYIHIINNTLQALSIIVNFACHNNSLLQYKVRGKLQAGKYISAVLEVPSTW